MNREVPLKAHAVALEAMTEMFVPPLQIEPEYRKGCGLNAADLRPYSGACLPKWDRRMQKPSLWCRRVMKAARFHW